jgi:hypothetical protein
MWGARTGWSWLMIAFGSNGDEPFRITPHYFKHILGSMKKKIACTFKRSPFTVPLHIIIPPHNKILNLGDVTELTVIISRWSQE